MIKTFVWRVAAAYIQASRRAKAQTGKFATTGRYANYYCAMLKYYCAQHAIWV